jgi:phosphoglycolate phosphatase-like HAD superfamily hydrolase
MDTVILDIDGTLLDSTYHHTVAWSRAFLAHGHRLPLWQIHRAIGMGGDRLVAQVAGDEVEQADGDSIRSKWEQEYDGIIDQVGLLDGAALLLDACHDRGLRVALASSSIPRHARYALALLDAEHRADGVTTAEDAEESKPDPELLDVALDRVDGHRALFVGDTIWDVRAAAVRGIPTVGVLSGGIGRDELLNAGAVGVYEGPHDLLRHLDEALRLTGEALDQAR